MNAISFLSDLKTCWALRRIEGAIACAESQLEWETAEWNTFFEPDGVSFPDHERRSRTGYLYDDDSLKQLRQSALDKLNQAYDAELKNPDSIEKQEGLKRARTRYFQADRDLATLHARRAYFYGRMQTAKRELDKRHAELEQRNEAKARIRSRFTLPRLKRNRKSRERFTRGEKLTIYTAIAGVVVAIGLTLLTLWLTGTI